MLYLIAEDDLHSQMASQAAGGVRQSDWLAVLIQTEEDLNSSSLFHVFDNSPEVVLHGLVGGKAGLVCNQPLL